MMCQELRYESSVNFQIKVREARLRPDIEESKTDLVNTRICRGRQEDGAEVDICHLE